MVPFDPGEPRPVRAEPRRGVKIAPGLQHARCRRAVERHLDEAVQRLPGTGGVVLAYPDHPPAPGIDRSIGIAQPAWHLGSGGDRHGCRTRRLAMEALVGIVAEPDRAGVDQKRAAAIFVDAGAQIEDRPAARRNGRGHIGNRAVRGAPNQDRAPALLGPRFEPVDIAAVEHDLAEPDRRGDDHVRGDRRRPRAIGCCLGLWHDTSARPNRRSPDALSRGAV